MREWLFVPLALVYLGVVGLLFLYGINFFYLTYLAWRHHRSAPLAPPALRTLPRVTVQLPIYNELYVAERLIAAAARLDYPRELLEIQVLDDSTDETVEVVRTAAAHWRAQGVNLAHLHRAERDGFKAGALAAGLERAHGEFIAIFDADFIPPADYLRRTLPHFADARAAFVQTRWGHVNRDYSLLTRLQAMVVDGHFMVEQFARSHAGYWFNFSGTAGVWRRAALEDAGGWQADTLTEDLDLSYRAFLRGWHALYLREVEVPAELPVNLVAYRRQQHRWARGSLECALKFLPKVWQRPMPLRPKFEATLHLTGYGIHLLMCALAVLYPLVLLLALDMPRLGVLLAIPLFFNATTFAPTLLFVTAQRQLRRTGWRTLLLILLLTIFGAGMMLNTARAALQIVLKRRASFERTPKFGIAQRSDDWLRRRYQLRLDPIVFVELGFALLNAATASMALAVGNWMIALYAALFCAGLLFTSCVTIAQAVRVQRAHAL